MPELEIKKGYVNHSLHPTEKYNKQLVILSTTEGTAKNKADLLRVWNERIKMHFPHYELVRYAFVKNGGKERV